MQLSNEHLHQRSASVISSMRSTYSSPEQLSMRLRFLVAQQNNHQQGIDLEAAKQGVPLEEEGLDADQVASRTQADEELCFVFLDTWRTATLGIGLLVRPRTIRERYRKLLPNIDLVEDYVSVEAYNTGVRAKFSAAMMAATAALHDRDDEEHQEESLMVKSSARGRINAWLPVFVNPAHWALARFFAPGAFSMIATQTNDTFQPVHALQVCARLMCASTVRFVINDQFMTEKALQMYCDIHRLFLQMMAEFPLVAQEADNALKMFIEVPSSRCRRQTADLGDLIQYLTVSSKYSWDDLKEAYVQEVFRRMARHIGAIATAELSTLDEVLAAWHSRHPESGRVTMFNQLFLDVMRPKHLTCAEVMASYDARWGKISPEQRGKLKGGYQEILKVSSPGEFLRRLGYDLSLGAITELVLWALENRQEGHTSYPGVPLKAGARVKEWNFKNEMWREGQANPPPPPPLPSPHRPQHPAPHQALQGSRHFPGSCCRRRSRCHPCCGPTHFFLWRSHGGGRKRRTSPADWRLRPRGLPFRDSGGELRLCKVSC